MWAKEVFTSSTLGLSDSHGKGEGDQFFAVLTVEDADWVTQKVVGAVLYLDALS